MSPTVLTFLNGAPIQPKEIMDEPAVGGFGGTRGIEKPETIRTKVVIRLFGPVAIEIGDRRLGPRDLGGTRPRQVLEILLAARGHQVTIDRLAELLWPHGRPRRMVGSVQTFVSVLRRHLSADRELARNLVVTEVAAYRFATELVDLDVDRFDALVGRSAREPTPVARRTLEQALALVGGEVLEDEPYAAWAEDLRGTYQLRLLDAHLAAADAALAELDHSAALAHAQAAIAIDRFSERAHRTTMLALYALGQQSEALRTYHLFHRRITSELGLEPTVQTRQLQSAILRQEDLHPLLPRLRAAEPPAPENPGGHALPLLGRAGELGALELAVRQALDGSFALLLVEGESGMGKTRVLDELATRLTGIRIGRSGCAELERHLSYVPLAALLRDAIAAPELRARHRGALRGIVPELPAAEFSEIDVLEALVDVLGEHAPLVLFIDDIHWADHATITALSYLRRRGAAIPAAVVATIRTEDAPPDHIARRLQPDQFVELTPLTPTDLAALGMPDLHRSTGGNPLLIAETVDNGGDAELSAPLAEKLLARCRSEGAASFRLLRVAATLAQPFDLESLAAVLCSDQMELIEEIERLCARRLLHVDGTRFGFRYEITRDALLHSLSPARRELLHLRGSAATLATSAWPRSG